MLLHLIDGINTLLVTHWNWAGWRNQLQPSYTWIWLFSLSFGEIVGSLRTNTPLRRIAAAVEPDRHRWTNKNKQLVFISWRGFEVLREQELLESSPQLRFHTWTFLKTQMKVPVKLKLSDEAVRWSSRLIKHFITHQQWSITKHETGSYTWILLDRLTACYLTSFNLNLFTDDKRIRPEL